MVPHFSKLHMMFCDKRMRLFVKMASTSYIMIDKVTIMSNFNIEIENQSAVCGFHEQCLRQPVFLPNDPPPILSWGRRNR
jgi:hypothetical protein